MTVYMVIIEGLVACLLVLLPCVIGIANGAVHMVFLYEKEVRERVVERGLITEKKIKRNGMLFHACLPLLVAFVLVSVYAVNGARGFWDGFWQILVILMTEGLFDRLFIDWFWVGHTKAWIIEGTEDLQPYIYGKSLAMKWVYTLVGYPVLAAGFAALMAYLIPC